MARGYRVIGSGVERIDAREKVTGRAKYTGDLAVAGMLHGKIVRSALPHARIRRIDASRAAALPGVVAVLTAADLEGGELYYSGRPIVAIEKVRYIGEPIAAVAALDPLTAEEAASLVEVEYEELPAVCSLDAAIAKGAPLVHEDAPGNVCAHEHVERGDVEQGFADSDAVFEHTFRFPMVYHYALEPHTVIAEFAGETLTVYSSAQHPFQVRGDLARLFGLPPSSVRMVVPYLGGGFGSKSYTKFEPLVAALARKAGRPVRVCNSVWESMLTVRRHAALIRLKTGVRKDGTLLARRAEIYLDTGGYADNGPQVAARAATRVIGPYRIPHLRSDAYAIYTNTGSAGSFRSIGGPQSIFAGETQMNIIAAELGLDPAELRFKNLLRRGEVLRPGLRPIDADLASSLRRLVTASRWRERAKKREAAVGLACGITNAGATPISVALVRLQADGTVWISAGSTEMGQGVRTVLAQVVAEELALPLASVRIGGADTLSTPYDSSTGSSRSTTLMGLAVQRAARDLKRQLVAIAARAFGVSPAKVRLVDGGLVCGEARLSYREALARRFGALAGELIGRGEVGPEVTGSLPVIWEVGMGSAEIELDEETGEVSIRRYVSVADVGKAINPPACVGQEEGAAMMGIGHTLFEEMRFEGCQLMNSSLLTYRVPAFADVPEEFDTVLVENEDGPGPYGSRGMGEGGIFPVAPAVVSALARRTGVFITDLPLTPERVWRAIREKRAGR
jgi:CO/xanthine dehydrogenase Mo-binding subunit